MELIERYLQAVGFWLPTPGKQDILAELSEDIYAQIEEQEQVAGRRLTGDEVGALLKVRGRPMFVANAYQPKRYLIGPQLFPIYSFVLKVLLACYAVPALLVWLALAQSSGWRVTHGLTFAGTIGPGVAHLWSAVLGAWATATVIFAVLEKTDALSKFSTKWDPAKLPKVRVPNRISRSSAIFESAITLALLIWWFTEMAPLKLINQPGLQVLLTPLWHTFFWGFSVVWLGNAGLAFANFLRPYWTPLRASFRLLLDAASTALFCWLVQSNIVSIVAISNQTTARCTAIKNLLNLWAGRSLPVVVITAVILATINAFRIVRASRPTDNPYGISSFRNQGSPLRHSREIL